MVNHNRSNESLYYQKLIHLVLESLEEAIWCNYFVLLMCAGSQQEVILASGSFKGAFSPVWLRKDLARISNYLTGMIRASLWTFSLIHPCHVMYIIPTAMPKGKGGVAHILHHILSVQKFSAFAARLRGTVCAPRLYTEILYLIFTHIWMVIWIWNKKKMTAQVCSFKTFYRSESKIMGEMF